MEDADLDRVGRKRGQREQDWGSEDCAGGGEYKSAFHGEFSEDVRWGDGRRIVGEGPREQGLCHSIAGLGAVWISIAVPGAPAAGISHHLAHDRYQAAKACSSGAVQVPLPTRVTAAPSRVNSDALDCDLSLMRVRARRIGRRVSSAQLRKPSRRGRA